MTNIEFAYFNPALNIVFNDWKTVYLLEGEPVLLKPFVHRSALVYRVPKTGKRISYKSIKHGLLKQKKVVRFEWAINMQPIKWL